MGTVFDVSVGNRHVSVNKILYEIVNFSCGLFDDFCYPYNNRVSGDSGAQADREG